MVTWLTELFQQPVPAGQYVILATLLFVATLMLSFAIALTILVRLPYDYFCIPPAKSVQDAGHGIFFRVGIVLKNLFGVVLILLGLVLSVPGLPGQGLLTIVAGVFLLDFPGKRSLLYKFVRRPLLLRSINRVRTRFSRPPLVIG
jgi:hypothetical protein